MAEDDGGRPDLDEGAEDVARVNLHCRKAAAGEQLLGDHPVAD